MMKKKNKRRNFFIPEQKLEPKEDPSSIQLITPRTESEKVIDNQNVSKEYILELLKKEVEIANEEILKEFRNMEIE
ncbi:MAG: hypothetical protein QXO70_04250 [Candidatus Pacearchaeota archaeon]